MAAPGPLLGGGITDDTLLHTAGCPPTAKGLLSLLPTCPRFAAKVIATPIDESDGGAAAAVLSIPEDTDLCDANKGIPRASVDWRMIEWLRRMWHSRSI